MEDMQGYGLETSMLGGFSGHDRMQRDVYYPERCTARQFVAYIDTDTMFVTTVIPEMLFVDSKSTLSGTFVGTKVGYLHDGFEMTLLA